VQITGDLLFRAQAAYRELPVSTLFFANFSESGNSTIAPV
jgi:hypothetical protein